MADKKNILRLRRGRSIGFALIGIMGFLIAGFVFQPVLSSIDNIAPEQQFEIPITEFEPEVTPETTLEDIGTPKEEIDEIIKDAEEGDIIDVGDPELDTIPEPISCTDSDPPVCNDQEPITSDDPVIEQIIDETKDTITDIVLPDTGSNTIRLIAEVTKTDSDGVSTVVTSSFDVPLQALFAESQTNRDFENGSLEIRLRAISSNPDFELTGKGNLDILIANTTIFTSQIPVSFSGISGEDGVTGAFTSQTGQKSNVFTFLFSQFIDRFPTQGSTPLEIKLNGLQLTLDSREQFGASQLDLFSMTIDTDPDLVIIIDEEGIPQRVYPQDTRFRYANYGDKFIDAGQCRSYWIRHSGTIELYDTRGEMDDQLLFSKKLAPIPCTTNTVIDTMLQRNNEYRLMHTLAGTTENIQDTIFDVTFTTPKSQKNFFFACDWDQFAGVSCTYPSSDASQTLRAPPEGGLTP